MIALVAQAVVALLLVSYGLCWLMTSYIEGRPATFRDVMDGFLSRD